MIEVETVNRGSYFVKIIKENSQEDVEIVDVSPVPSEQPVLEGGEAG